MALIRARKPSISIEMLNLYTLIRDVAASVGDLGDPEERAKFLGEIEAALDQSLGDQRRLHGLWTQDLFRAVLISLDGIAMIKDEDCGEFYFKGRAPGPAGLPRGDPRRRATASRGQERWRAIRTKAAEATRLDCAGTAILRSVDRGTAAVCALLGGRTITGHWWTPRFCSPMASILCWTRTRRCAPTALRDARRPGHHHRRDHDLVPFLSRAQSGLSWQPGFAFADLPVPFELGATEFMCNGKPLIRPDERRVAAFLFLYGGGTGPVELEVDEQGTPMRLNLTWSSPAGPESPNVGYLLSSMFSNRYMVQTKRLDGTVDLMRHHPDPELTRLLPTNYAEIPGWVLPLWVAHQSPNRETQDTK